MKDNSIEMSVSPITHDKNGKPQVFISFTDGERIHANKGFSDEEVHALELYMKKEKATILSMAKKIDIMAAFLGK